MELYLPILQVENAPFLKGIDLVYIIGILSTVTGAIWTFYRFRYEKKLEKFKDANTDLFTDDKQKKLAAIATLSVFKSDRMFGKSTTNVLLSKLYTETDYDITYAIGSALIQFSNRRTLLRIASEIAGINRNFFIQVDPYKERLEDIKYLFEKGNKLKNDQAEELAAPEGEVTDIEKEEDVVEKKSTRYKEEFLKLSDKISYEINGQQIVTADAYGRIIRLAATKRQNLAATVFYYFKGVIIFGDFNFYPRSLTLYLYQNIFARIQLVKINTIKCDIWRSSLEYATIADVYFGRPGIYDSSFEGVYLTDCTFRKGKISSSLMVNMELSNINFHKIDFSDIYFAGSSFSNCRFSNCTGLGPESFYATRIDNTTKAGLPKEMLASIEKIEAVTVIERILTSGLITDDKKKILVAIAKGIRKAREIYPVLILPLIENAIKDKMVVEMSVNFKLKDLFDMQTGLRSSDHITTEWYWYILFRLLSHKRQEDIIVEVFDAAIDEIELKYLLENVWPGTKLEDYKSLIQQSILSNEEKEKFLERIKEVLFPRVVRKLKRVKG